MIHILDFIEKPNSERQTIMNKMTKKELKEFVMSQSQFIVDFVIKKNNIFKVVLNEND
jgi:hypothetical protein